MYNLIRTSAFELFLYFFMQKLEHLLAKVKMNWNLNLFCIHMAQSNNCTLVILFLWEVQRLFVYLRFVPFHVVQHFQGLVTQPCYAIFKFVHFSFRFVPSFTHELQINFSRKALLSILYCVWPELVSLPLLTLVWPSCPPKTSMNEISFRLLSLLQDVLHYHYTALESGVL